MEWVDLECLGRGAALGRRASKKPHTAWPERSEGNWDVTIDARGAVAAIVFGPFLKKPDWFQFQKQVGTSNAIGCDYYCYGVMRNPLKIRKGEASPKNDRK